MPIPTVPQELFQLFSIADVTVTKQGLKGENMVIVKPELLFQTTIGYNPTLAELIISLELC